MEFFIEIDYFMNYFSGESSHLNTTSFFMSPHFHIFVCVAHFLYLRNLLSCCLLSFMNNVHQFIHTNNVACAEKKKKNLCTFDFLFAPSSINYVLKTDKVIKQCFVLTTSVKYVDKCTNKL